MRRDGSLAFGQEAKENFDEQRSIRSIKRILGTGERVPFVGQNLRTEQIAVMLFSKLKRDAREAPRRERSPRRSSPSPPTRKGLARHATKLCAGAAGLQVLTLINEPTAAAICYGLNAQQDQTVLVYDFGGGTLDVTILRIHHGIFEEISSKGIGKLGGDDLDAALGNLLAKRFQEKTGYDILNSPYKTQFMLAVEKAKIDLSEPADRPSARKAELVPERHLSLEEEIDRQTFEKEIMPLVVKSGTAIDEALTLRGMRPKDIDEMLLVGGTSKIPLIRRFVSEKLAGKEPEPFDKVDPMTCVAQGAAIVSAILQGAPGLDNHAYSVKLEHSLCANPINEKRQVYLDPIIKRGVDIPCSFTKTYHPVADPAERVIISVFEGDVYDDPDSPENVKLAEIPWEFQPPRPQQRRGPGGHLRVRRRRHPDRADPRHAHRAQEALRHPAERPGPDGRRPDHEDEAHQRGPDEAQREPGEHAGIPRCAGDPQEDRAGRDPEGRGPGRQARAGGAVPAGARGDGVGRPQADGGRQLGAERSAAELRVFAVVPTLAADRRRG